VIDIGNLQKGKEESRRRNRDTSDVGQKLHLFTKPGKKKDEEGKNRKEENEGRQESRQRGRKKRWGGNL